MAVGGEYACQKTGDKNLCLLLPALRLARRDTVLLASASAVGFTHSEWERQHTPAPLGLAPLLTQYAED